MRPPLVTIATITWNNLPELQMTVSSVLLQDRQLFEFLIIDGASTDGTLQYLETLDSSALRWLSEKDRGIADAFNKAQRMATGEMLVFMNAGDTFAAEDTLAKFVAAVPPIKRSAIIAYGDYIAFDETSEKKFITDHRLLHQTNSINHQSTLIGREIYRSFEYDSRLFLGMDYDYWLRCERAGIEFFKVPQPVARFKLGGRSSSLDYRVHTSLIRHFLRAINSGKTLSIGDGFVLFANALKSFAKVLIRRLVGRHLVVNAKRLLHRS